MTKKKVEDKKPAAKKPAAKKVVSALDHAKNELDELKHKIEAIHDFKINAEYKKLDKIAQKLIRIQLLHMESYAETLALRIKNW